MTYDLSNDLLTSLQDGGGSKLDFLPVLLSWKEKVTSDLKDLHLPDTSCVEQEVGQWLMATRLQGRQLQPLACNVV